MKSSTLASLENFTDIGLRSGVDMRPTLVRVLTDLYVQKLTHTPAEERHYTELALRMLEAVDVQTRAAVAVRLTRHLAPPVRVMERLASDVPDVAALVRSHRVLQPAEKMSAPALLPEFAPVAETTAPDDRETVAVIETAAPDEREHDTARAASAPGAIGFDIASELNELFFAANANERRLILLNLEVVAPLQTGRVSIARDTFVGQRLEAAALSRNREEFAQHLAQSLHIPREQAQRIASDDLGESVVAATKALHMPRDVVYRIILFINTAVGHSVERVHALAALYDEMTPQAAEHMVAIWQALQKDRRATGRHQPLLWNDEIRVRARPATAAVQRTTVAPRTGERRDAS